MSRGPRYVPPGWSVEITTRTICGFYLLRPTAQFSRIFVAVLARAQKRHPVKIHAGKLHNWRGSFWSERYHLIPISPEPEALISRLRYVLSNTVKEGLVAHVSEWEGLHCAQALIDGKPLHGVWYDRSKEYEARRQAARKAARRGTAVEEVSRGGFITPYELKLDPLPCWAETPRAKIRKYVAEMVGEIETVAAQRRKELGIEPRGMERIRSQNPFDRPNRSKKTPKPLCHVASVEMRDRVKQAYRGFAEMFRQASAKVKFGDVAGAVFPKGSFPPSLPFVHSGEEFDPLADAGGSLGVAIWASASS